MGCSKKQHDPDDLQRLRALRLIDDDFMTVCFNNYIIYVNGSMKTKDTALGRLISDFYCTDAKDMCYKELSERVRHFKETEKGVDTMCDILDEMKNEASDKRAADIALNMITAGKLTFEEIAKYSGLPIEKVRELAGNKSA